MMDFTSEQIEYLVDKAGELCILLTDRCKTAKEKEDVFRSINQLTKLYLELLKKDGIQMDTATMKKH
jgi:hypothetical protein